MTPNTVGPDVFVLRALSGVGDFVELKYIFDRHIRPSFRSMSPQQIKDYSAYNAYCSALVKVLHSLFVLSVFETRYADCRIC